MPKYNVGDKVWYCDNGTHEFLAPCPDCLGSGRLTVIMGDGAHVGIDCDCCRDGIYHTGQVKRYEWAAKCCQGRISGLEIDGKKVEYHIGTSCQYYSRKENEVFDTEDEAKTYAEILKAEHEIADEQEFQRKAKGHKSWAWNATYHRRAIRDCEKQIESHKKKLEVAKAKAKEPIED